MGIFDKKLDLYKIDDKIVFLTKPKELFKTILRTEYNKHTKATLNGIYNVLLADVIEECLQTKGELYLRAFVKAKPLTSEAKQFQDILKRDYNENVKISVLGHKGIKTPIYHLIELIKSSSEFFTNIQLNWYDLLAEHVLSELEEEYEEGSIQKNPIANKIKEGTLTIQSRAPERKSNIYKKTPILHTTIYEQIPMETQSIHKAAKDLADSFDAPVQAQLKSYQKVSNGRVIQGSMEPEHISSTVKNLNSAIQNLKSPVPPPPPKF